MISKLRRLFFNQQLTVGTKNLKTRDEWIQSNLINLKAGLRILDAGAGEQPYKKFCNHLDYVSQDFCEYIPSALEKGLQMSKWDYGKLDLICDITSIPEPNDSFDVILCTEVIEHISNPIQAITEFSRLLKKDGILILTAPFCSLTHFAPHHYYTGFSEFFYEKELTKAGFLIIEENRNGNYFEYLAQELRRLEQTSLKYSKTNLRTSEKKIINQLLRLLEMLSNKDNGSNELLCHGIHILAVKKNIN